MSSVGAELPRQMARGARRVRMLAVGVVTTDNRVLISRYLSAIDRAAEALATQDAVACLVSFQELQALEG